MAASNAIEIRDVANTTSITTLPFDAALHRDFMIFMKFGGKLSKTCLEGITEIYTSLQAQQNQLKELYALCKETFDVQKAIDAKAFAKYIPVFLSQVERQLFALNELLGEEEDTDWKSIEATLANLDDAFKQMQAQVQGFVDTMRAVKSKAQITQDAARDVGRNALQCAAAALDWTRQLAEKAWKYYEDWLYTPLLILSGITYCGEVGICALEGGAAAAGTAAAGQAAVFVSFAGAGVVLAGVAISAAYLNRRFQMYAAEQHARMSEAAAVVEQHAKNTAEMAEKAVVASSHVSDNLRNCQTQIEHLMTLSRLHTNTQQRQMSLKQLRKEMKYARELFQESFAGLPTEELHNLKDLVPEIERMTGFLNVIEPRGSDLIWDDILAVLLSEWSYKEDGDGSGLMLPIGFEMKNSKRYNRLQGEGIFSGIVAAEVHRNSHALQADDAKNLTPHPGMTVVVVEEFTACGRYIGRDHPLKPGSRGVVNRVLEDFSAQVTFAFSSGEYIILPKHFSCLRETVSQDDELYPALFIAFKGSVDIEWVCNINFAPNWDAFGAIGAERNIAIHRGYHAEIEAMSKVLLQVLLERLDHTQFRRIVFTGHSHGAALAQVALARIFMEKMKGNPWEVIPEHHRHLFEKSSAVCFASPQVLGFRGESAIGEQLSKFMHERVINYAFRCDPVPRCPSNINLEMLRSCLASAGTKCWLLESTGMRSYILEPSAMIRDHEEALHIYKHVSKVLLFGDSRQCPEQWGGDWSKCSYDLNDHSISAYKEALFKFERRDTSVTTYLLDSKGLATKVLYQV